MHYIHVLHLVHCQKCCMKVCIICWNKAQLIAPFPSFVPSIILLRKGSGVLHPCLVGSGLCLSGKQPGHYCGIWAILHYAVNLFSYETAKNEAKDENCVVSTRRCNGPHNKLKHKFSRRMFLGHVISPLDHIPWPVCFPYPSGTFFSVFHLKSKVYASPPHCVQETKVHIAKGLGTINSALLQ